ncbi:MAG: YihA family ribosome biogenesis GTP-binding protein [Verrucomicrobiota bacterium]|nr:YihA family ribosome biogenesis GTP-binding protein [Verrucomicrobiota bacterium]
MSKLSFEQGRFAISALDSKEFPRLKNDQGNRLPEIALAGRSNVGKSSLINALLKIKGLAKTSATPGKTQRINFFVIDEKALFVDLPGYGYSKAPKKAIREWSQAIDLYLNQSTELRLLLLLIDIRRTPSEEDLTLAEWAIAKKIPLLVIFTKRDKLSSSESKKKIEWDLSEKMSFSSHELGDRKMLIRKINEALQWD